MNINNFLIEDSKKCLSFIESNQSNFETITISDILSNFANNFMYQYETIINNIQLSNEMYNIQVSTSNNPHFLNFLNQNNVNLFSDKESDYDIDYLSEILSSKNKNEIDYYYDLAISNFTPMNQFKELYHRFCPLNIQFYIEQKINFLKIYSGSFSEIRITLMLYTHHLSIKNSYIYDLVSRLLTINILSKKPRMEIICKLWLTDFKKYLPRLKVLSSHCINTASTYCHHCNDIKIWRIEESKKVACHEIFHCIGLDFHDIPDFFIKKLISVFNIPDDTQILIFETYVELWATIINSICLAYNLKRDIGILNQLINYERYFSVFQSAKIINFFNFDSFESFFNLNGFVKKKNNFKQNTCSISYYIIKSALLFSLNDFLQFCNSNNTESIINFKETEDAYKNFLKLILSSLNNKSFKNQINKAIKIIKSLSKEDYIYRNLRMTCLEYY